MQKYLRKVTEVSAEQFNGPGSLTVVSHKFGEQIARPGNFLVVDDSVAPGKGSVYVMSKDEFLATFEAMDGTPIVSDPLYGVPNYETLELARAAATAATELPMRCTIGANSQLYSVQHDGFATQIAVVTPDPTVDAGPAFTEGARVGPKPRIKAPQATT